MAHHGRALLTPGALSTGAAKSAAVAAVLTGCGLMFAQTWAPDAAAPLPQLRAAVGSAAGDFCIPDVDHALQELPSLGLPLRLADGALGVEGGLRRHWQGIQRLTTAGGTYFFLSRSGGGHAVAVVRFGADTNPGRLATRENRAAPQDSPAVVATLPYDSGFGHAGGMALIHHQLLVPMDGRAGAGVALYDVSNPGQPRRMGRLRIDRGLAPRVPANASAVGIARLATGRYLMVLGVRSSKALEFHLSADTTMLSASHRFSRLGVILGLDVGGFQSLALLRQCDGQLYLAGTHNTALPPPSRGRDHIHWYRLRVAGSGWHLDSAQERWLTCRFCNLGAAAGFYLTPDGAPLLYATGFGKGGGASALIVEEFGR